MAEDHPHQDNVGKAPWLKIFTAFKVALDPKKLLLAGLGILVTSLGLWLLSVVFFNLPWLRNRPLPDLQAENFQAEYKSCQESRRGWNLLYELAGPGTEKPDAGDVARNPEEYQKIKEYVPGELKTEDLPQIQANIVAKETGEKRDRLLKLIEIWAATPALPSGRLRTWPWSEYRGRNQFLVVADAIQQVGQENQKPLLARSELRTCFLVMIEPLAKFLLPVVYFFDDRAGGFFSWNRLYLVLAILWILLVWGFIGGAITRMAAVQVARNEKVGFTDALKFAQTRLGSYFAAPLLPLIFLALLGLFLWCFGLALGWTFFIGDILAGLFWPIVLVVGLIMAVVLVGLVGWPLMNATISSEGSDSFDALSRSYSYVFQAPWHYLWYGFLSVIYGAVLVFFVGFMGSLVVYMGKWGVSQAPVVGSQDPAALFVYAPTSFGWRDLALHDSPHAVLGTDGHYVLKENGKDFREALSWYNRLGIGTALVTFWLTLFFLLIVGFGYSYFWTASTIIYLLMRQKVDDTDLDEIHLEEEDLDQPLAPDKTPTTPQPSAPPAPPAPPSSSPPGVTFTMVDAPTMKPPVIPADTPAVPPAATPVATPATPPVAPAVPPEPIPPVNPDPQSSSGNSPPQ